MTPELGKELFEIAPNTTNMEPLDFQKNLNQGCSTTLVGALDPALPNASYLHDCQIGHDVAPHAVSKENAAKLWEVSNKLTGESFP